MTLGRIGPYRITGELGRGGIGTVYRGHDASGRGVAIKCLLASVGGETDQRLLRESSFRIDHPNVVRTLGGGLGADGRPYLVLELLEGTTLRDAMAAASARDVIEWVRQAALGLGALHTRGLVHRDVKPENLFLCNDGTVKVLDLGIAAWRDERARLTATGAVIGTPAYLAPEQVRGARVIDPRSDVWALGVVLYEGLTGRAPFRREGALATMLAIAIDPLTRLDEVVPGLDPSLVTLVHQCLERPVERRLSSAALVAEGLAAVLAAPERVPVRASAPPASVVRSLAVLVAQAAAADVDRIEDLVRASDGEPIRLADGRVLGAFGAREARGDEAARTIATARSVARIAAPVAIAIGRGAVGAAVTGEVVREADEALARAPGGVVCGPSTAQVLRGSVMLEEIVPGLFDVGEAHASQSQLTPLLARDVELAMLRRARDAALLERRPVVTWIVGAPGTGKTRLAEAARSLAAETDPPMIHREAHARPGHVDALALFGRALGIERVSVPHGEGGDATMRADLAREGLLDELGRVAAQGALAVVLEDAQWADPMSLALIEDAARALDGRAIWLVVTGRPELFERLREVPDRSSIVEPAPLGARDAIELARARGHRALSLATAQALVAHTGGNPLFLELILGAHDGLPEVSTLALTPLPATVEYAVRARLDQLNGGDRNALVRLALLGRPSQAAELTELGAVDAESCLERLAARDLCTRGSAGGGRTYRVRSPVVAQVAATLPDDAERRALHRRVSVIAEARGDDEEVAIHREAAGDREAAAGAYLAAALAAVHGGDARKVLRCGDRALLCGLDSAEAFALHLARADAARWAGDPEARARALDDADRAAETPAERGVAASERGELLRARGDLPGAVAAFEEAIGLSTAAGDVEAVARASCRRAIALTMSGAHEAATAILQAIDPGTLTVSMRGLCEDARGFVAGSTGDLGERRAAFRRAATAHAAAGDVRRAAGAEQNAADAAIHLGLYADAERELRRAIELARRVGNRLTEGYALANLGHALTRLGRSAEAKVVLTDALGLASSMRERHLHAAAMLYRCRADLDGEGTLRAIDPLTALSVPETLRVGALALEATLLLAKREPVRACDRALAGVALVEQGAGVEEGEAEAYVVAGRALRAAGRDEEADALLARGRARLQAQAARIADETARASFLERVPEHRELVSSQS